MKRIFIGAIAAAFLLAIPSLAGAHSGAVSCDSAGVLFTYNANFATAKTATEHVGNSVYTFNITPNVVNTHLVPLPATSPVVVSSTWGGPGSIIPRALNCPTAPPACLSGEVNQSGECITPVPPPRPVCPVGYADAGLDHGILRCTITNTVIETIPPVYYECPKGTKLVSYKSGATICQKTVIKVKTKTKIKTVTRWVQWCPKPPKPTPGVAG